MRSYLPPVRRRNVFNGYDFLAKSLPGVALLIGVATLLPHSIISNIQGSLITNVAGFLVIAGFLGLLLGEAVHTLAETIEKAIFIPLRKMKSGYKYIRIYLINTTQRIPQSEFKRNEHIRDGGALITLKIYLYWRLNLAFKPHRQLLADLVRSNYAEFLGYWRKNEKGVLFDEFKNKIAIRYGMKIEEEIEELTNLYPLILSEIYLSPARLSKRYQAIFSFCRSMWMTFFLLSVAYIHILVNGQGEFMKLPYGSSYEPIGVSLISAYSIPVEMVPIATGIVATGFLSATAKYKYHYIEYIIADYPKICDETNNNASSQTQLGKWAGEGQR